MRETLRLSPTAPARTVAPFEDVTIGGKYFVRKGQSIIVNTYDCQRDRKVWGDDVSKSMAACQTWTDSLTFSQADEFKPERMLDGKYEALPVSIWMSIQEDTRHMLTTRRL